MSFITPCTSQYSFKVLKSTSGKMAYWVRHFPSILTTSVWFSGQGQSQVSTSCHLTPHVHSGTYVWIEHIHIN